MDALVVAVMDCVPVTTAVPPVGESCVGAVVGLGANVGVFVGAAVLVGLGVSVGNGVGVILAKASTAAFVC